MASLQDLVDIIRSTVRPIVQTGQLVQAGIQGQQAGSEAAELRRSARRGIDQQTRIAGELDTLTRPLREQGAGFLKDVLQGERPPLLKRITGPQTGSLARQFSGAREAIRSRVSPGGFRQRFLSNSFIDEARARTDIESGFASNALNQSLGIGFRVPINAANIFGSGARSNLTLAQQQAQRAAAAGESFGTLIGQKFP